RAAQLAVSEVEQRDVERQQQHALGEAAWQIAGADESKALHTAGRDVPRYQEQVEAQGTDKSSSCQQRPIRYLDRPWRTELPKARGAERYSLPILGGWTFGRGTLRRRTLSRGTLRRGILGW